MRGAGDRVGEVNLDEALESRPRFLIVQPPAATVG